MPQAGEDALFGTVDTWLLWCITGGPGKGLHMTDVSNASRTMMIDLSKTDASGRPAWDPPLMAVFGAKPSMMPKIVDSSGGEHESGGYGPISGEMPGYAKFGCKGLEGVPVGGMLGDQQAALFGQVVLPPDCHSLLPAASLPDALAPVAVSLLPTTSLTLSPSPPLVVRLATSLARPSARALLHLYPTRSHPQQQRPLKTPGHRRRYGTGCFLLLNTGDQFTPSSQGLLTTAAYKIK